MRGPRCADACTPPASSQITSPSPRLAGRGVPDARRMHTASQFPNYVSLAPPRGERVGVRGTRCADACTPPASSQITSPSPRLAGRGVPDAQRMHTASQFPNYVSLAPPRGERVGVRGPRCARRMHTTSTFPNTLSNRLHDLLENGFRRPKGLIGQKRQRRIGHRLAGHEIPPLGIDVDQAGQELVLLRGSPPGA